MNEKLTIQKVIDILESNKYFLMPVKQLWIILKNKSDSYNRTMEELIEFLRHDQRIQIFEQNNNQITGNPDLVISIEEMGKLGFYQGPWIMLKDRMPSRNEIMNILIRKADHTYKTLKKVWDIRPQDNEVVEDRFLYALTKAQQLQKELRMLVE